MGANQSYQLKTFRGQNQTSQRKNSRISQDSVDSTVSLNIVNVRGRAFLKNSNDTYLLAADDLEVDRLNQRHDVQWFIWKSLFSSPVKTLLNLGGMNVLDEQIFPNLLRLLKPGGWLEITEYERKLYEAGPNSEFLMDKLSSVFHNRGASGIPAYEILPDLFQKNNLIEFRREDKFVKYRDIQLAINDFFYTFNTLKYVVMEFTSLGSSKYEKLLTDACKELVEYETTFHVTRFYAQKPHLKNSDRLTFM
ncbi:1373_t:CDS:2 [Acaulospora colombiana]|uniref:1373_t:CDS:1 n=1 Tax=Acaulospora colombiana TaxID=27376 RepID=A0ACA9L3Q6_9GLOM|nr:1373_t:CDS:2 [Acaulospora colombiana]